MKKSSHRKKRLPIEKSAISEADQKKFWARVTKIPFGCWEWIGPKNRKGYGNVSVACEALLAHRVSYALHYGSCDTAFLCCHKCDNPKCVNPQHLFLGSTKDNIYDSISKGRFAVSRKRRFSALDIAQIRHLKATGSTMPAIGKRFGVSDVTIFKIVKRITYKTI